MEQHSSEPSQPTGHFLIQSGTDGTQQTVDIITVSTGKPVASIPYCDGKADAKRHATQLVDALNLLFEASETLDLPHLVAAFTEVSSATGEGFDSDAFFALSNQIAVVWNIEDVREVRSDLDDASAWTVLQSLIRDHDACFGINWDVIRCVADELFPHER